MDINVLHAEREFVRDDKSLGSFRLDWIPPAPRGVPHIAVKFDIDANGILSVTAVDKGTGNKQDITITRASTLSSDEVERMVSEAERFAKEDVEKRDTINTKNQDDRVVYQTEKQLKVLSEKEPAHVKKKVEAELTEKEAVSGGSYTSNEGCHGRAESGSNAVGTVSVYNQPDAGRAPGGADSTGPVPGSEPSGTSGGKGAKDGDVIDVNFTDSK